MTAPTLFVLVALALRVTAQSFTDLVTFGDSYTDDVNIGDGGVPWPVYAVSYANASLHPFAKSGGTCSNNITERPYPSVRESQIPAYLAEIKNGSLSDLNPNETLHSLWIGTNDLGAGALLTGSSAGNLVQATECMVDWVKVLYEEAGARNFLFQNVSHLPRTSIVFGKQSHSICSSDNPIELGAHVLPRCVHLQVLGASAQLHRI